MHIKMNRRSLLAAGGATAVSACLSNSPSKGDREIGMVEETSNTLEWRSAPSLSRPVQEIYPAMHGGEIWLSGGLVAEAGRITGPTVETHIFNRQSNAWRPGPALPTPRHHPHLQSHQGVLFCIGGFEVMAADAVWIMQNGGWKLTSNGWEPLTPAPSPIGEAVTASIGEGLHVCGGRQPKGEVNRDTADHTDVGAHHVLIADVWETAAPLPTPRNSATAEMINADWRVVGGRTVANGNSTAHEVYDSQEDRWRSAAPLPASRSGLASGVLDGRLYVFGGESLVGERDVFGDCWVYDPASDTWEEGPRMMTPRHGLGGVVLGDGLYAIGGAERPSGEATSNAVEVLDSIV